MATQTILPNSPECQYERWLYGEDVWYAYYDYEGWREFMVAVSEEEGNCWDRCGVPHPGVKVLAYGKRSTAMDAEWHIAMRGHSILEPEKGVFWFTDAGMVLEVEHWEPLPSPPTKEQP